MFCVSTDSLSILLIFHKGGEHTGSGETASTAAAAHEGYLALLSAAQVMN